MNAFLDTNVLITAQQTGEKADRARTLPYRMISRNDKISQSSTVKVSKWGNSLAVRLPKALVEELHLAPGDELTVLAANRTVIVVEKRDRRAEFLKAMEQFRRPAPEGYTFDRDEANEISAV